MDIFISTPDESSGVIVGSSRVVEDPINEHDTIQYHLWVDRTVVGNRVIINPSVFGPVSYGPLCDTKSNVSRAIVEISERYGCFDASIVIWETGSTFGGLMGGAHDA